MPKLKNTSTYRGHVLERWYGQHRGLDSDGNPLTFWTFHRQGETPRSGPEYSSAYRTRTDAEREIDDRADNPLVYSDSIASDYD